MDDFLTALYETEFEMPDLCLVTERFTSYCLDDVVEAKIPASYVDVDLVASQDHYGHADHGVDEENSSLHEILGEPTTVGVSPEAVLVSRMEEGYDRLETTTESRHCKVKTPGLRRYQTDRVLGVYAVEKSNQVAEASEVVADHDDVVAATRAIERRGVGGRCERSGLRYDYFTGDVAGGSRSDVVRATSVAGADVAAIRLHVAETERGDVVGKLTVERSTCSYSPKALSALGAAVANACASGDVVVRDVQYVTLPTPECTGRTGELIAPTVEHSKLKPLGLTVHDVAESFGDYIVDVLAWDSTGAGGTYRRAAADVSGGLVTGYSRSGSTIDYYVLHIDNGNDKYSSLRVSNEWAEVKNPPHNVVDATPANGPDVRFSLSSSRGAFTAGAAQLPVRSVLATAGDHVVDALEVYPAVSSLVRLGVSAGMHVRIDRTLQNTTVVATRGPHAVNITVRRSMLPVEEGMFVVERLSLPAGIVLPRKLRWLTPLATLAELSSMGDRCSHVPPQDGRYDLDISAQAMNDGRLLVYAQCNVEFPKLAGAVVGSVADVEQGRATYSEAELGNILSQMSRYGVNARWCSRRGAGMAALCGVTATSQATCFEEPADSNPARALWALGLCRQQRISRFSEVVSAAMVKATERYKSRH